MIKKIIIYILIGLDVIVFIYQMVLHDIISKYFTQSTEFLQVIYTPDIPELVSLLNEMTDDFDPYDIESEYTVYFVNISKMQEQKYNITIEWKKQPNFERNKYCGYTPIDKRWHTRYFVIVSCDIPVMLDQTDIVYKDIDEILKENKKVNRNNSIESIRAEYILSEKAFNLVKYEIKDAV